MTTCDLRGRRNALNHLLFAVFLTLHISYVILTLVAGLAVLWRVRAETGRHAGV